MNYLLRLSLILLALGASNAVGAFSLNHVENLSGVYTANTSKKEAFKTYKQIRTTSRGLSFLNCPIKLIEMQYNGIESVLVGTEILNSYFDDNNMNMGLFQKIMSDCENTLNAYEEGVRQKTVVSRFITDEEFLVLAGQISNSSTPNQIAITSLVMNTINQDTVCYVKRTAVELAYVLGGSLGNTSAECFTPMGRHFMLMGPSIGYGIGAIAAITLPNTELIPSAPNWSFKLYEQKHGMRLFHEEHNSIQSGVVIGTSQELKSGKSSVMKFGRDVKALLGYGIMFEHTHNLLLNVPLRSLYFSLNKAVDLNMLINKIAHMDR